MNKYAVIGNPINHSKSPLIHAAFAEQENVCIDYQRMLANKDNFKQTVNHFFNNGGNGLNVTVPFKVDAYEQCIHLNEYALAAKAVNTISVNESKQWLGANTDGIGLLRDLKENINISLKGKNILILGAGGATRGILLPLLQEHTGKIVIANRTVDKALELANAFNEFGLIQGCGYEDLDQKPFDVILNATSASLDNTMPPISQQVVNEQSICYDLVYSDQATAFMSWAIQIGVKHTYDGLGMLIEQAAESYYIWRGFRPSTKELFSLLRPSS